MENNRLNYVKQSILKINTNIKFLYFNNHLNMLIIGNNNYLKIYSNKYEANLILKLKLNGLFLKIINKY